ncbi:MAG: fasciclin domain-containing protein [Planctomycetota bacterium]
MHPIHGFLLLATLCTPAAAGDPGHENAPLDVVATAASSDSFTTLAKAIEAAGLTHALREEGPFTVFAPTDQAFAALPEDTVAALFSPEGKDDLAAILKFHVAPANADAAHVAASRGLSSLAGQRLDVRATGGAVTVAGARVIQADIACSNGFVHAIDRVLLPASGNLVETAQGAGDFGTLLKACKAAGLVDALSGHEPLTVLAPTDAAFERLSDGTLETLLKHENRDALRELLSYHVIPGRSFADETLSAGTVAPLAGPGHLFRIEDGRLRAGAATVLANDVQASNGVIHAIDRVLLPPGFRVEAGRLVVGFFSDPPSEALARQLGLDRHGSLVVTNVSSGSNAESFGLEAYDVITAMNGKPATDGRLAELKRELGFNGTVHFSILRAGKPLALDIPIGLEPH